MFSVLLVVKNEELLLPRSLESLSFCDDIVVLDSYSQDASCDIALSVGARVIHRPNYDKNLAFGGDESLHRNWGIHNISYKYPWLFVIDADELLSPNAISELLALSSDPNPRFVAWRIRRRDFFQGRQLHHVQTSAFYTRFFRPEKVHYERLINPVIVVDGLIGDLQHTLDHYPFAKGLSHWFARHNSYSSFEAQQIIDNRNFQETFSLRSAFFERDFNIRRFHQKELFYRLPARPLVKFFLLFFFKCGFLDGRPGFTYTLLQSVYEYMIVLKVKELENID